MLTPTVTRRSLQGISGTIKFLEKRDADFSTISTAIGTQTDPVIVKSGLEKPTKKTARRRVKKKTLNINIGKRKVRRRDPATGTRLQIKHLPAGGATESNAAHKPASRRRHRRATGRTNATRRVGHSVRSLRVHRTALLKNEVMGQDLPRVFCQTAHTRKAYKQPKWSKFSAWSRHATSGLAIPVFFMTR